MTVGIPFQIALPCRTQTPPMQTVTGSLGALLNVLWGDIYAESSQEGRMLSEYINFFSWTLIVPMGKERIRHM